MDSAEEGDGAAANTNVPSPRHQVADKHGVKADPPLSDIDEEDVKKSALMIMMMMMIL